MFRLFKNRKLEKVTKVVSLSQGGVYKRIDENRELLQLLQQNAPEFIVQNPWVEGWLESQDDFLEALAAAVSVDRPRVMKGWQFPRPWPGRSD